MKVGKDAVVVGNVPAGSEIGEGSVIVGATDANGNTILNTSMALGRNASAGPNSIAIGAGANAGAAPNPAALIHELVLLAEQNERSDALEHLRHLAAELEKPTPDKSIIFKAWDGVKTLATVNGAYTLLSNLAQLIGVVWS